MANHRNIPLAIAGTFGALGVAMGAFGAHALRPTLTELGTIEVWKTAVAYQMWHALLLAFLAQQPALKCERMIRNCLVTGVVLFSGSLYGLALAGPPWLGPITPIGGLLLIVSWLLCIQAALRNTSH